MGAVSTRQPDDEPCQAGLGKTTAARMFARTMKNPLPHSGTGCKTGQKLYDTKFPL